MKKIKKQKWGSWVHDADTSSFHNHQYTVHILSGQSVFGSTMRATIQRRDKRPITRTDIQRIKNEVFGPEAEGFEVYGDAKERPVGPVTATLWVLAEQTVPVTDSLKAQDLLPAAKSLLRAVVVLDKDREVTAAGTMKYIDIIGEQCAQKVDSLHETTRAKLIELDDIRNRLDRLCKACSDFSAKKEETKNGETHTTNSVPQ